MGEIDFFRLDRNLDAATHYMAAAKGIPPTEKTGPLADMRHDALYNALVALSREMDAKAAKKQTGETEADKKYAEALDLYAHYYPNDPQLPAMFYRQGKYYFDNANYDSAVKIWGMLLEKFPNSEQSRDAGDSILESFNRAKNYENIETWARRLKALPSFSGAKQQERLDALIVQAVFKQGEQKAAAGDHAAAAGAYLRAAKEFPKDARAAQACVNAEQEAKLGGDVKTLQEAAQLAMGPQYRDKPESPGGAWIATTTLQAMGLFADAADIAEQMASLGDREHPNYSKYEHEKDAAYNAVDPARGDRRERPRGARRQQVPRRPTARRPRPTRSCSRWAARTRTPGAPRTRRSSTSATSRARRTSTTARRGWCCWRRRRSRPATSAAPPSSLDEAVSLGKKRGARAVGRRQVRRRARPLHGGRAGAGEVRADHDPGRRQAAQGAPQAEDRAAEGRGEDLPRLRVDGRGRVDDGGALPDRPHVRGVRQGAARLAAAARGEDATIRRPTTSRRSRSSPSRWRSGAWTPTRTAGRRRSISGIYNQWTAKMRDALGRLNSELYPPFKETGFEVRSQGPLPLPPLIEAPNRPVAAVASAPEKK